MPRETCSRRAAEAPKVDTAGGRLSTAFGDKTMRIRIVRVVERQEVAVTRLALERAGWRCESCQTDIDLRVVEDGAHRYAVLCLSCRIDAGWVPEVTRG